MTLKNTFGREERLKSRLAIQNLLQNGHQISRFPIKIFWDFSPDPGQRFPAKAAISVPKRKFRRAVDRNLMKRRLREAYRLQKGPLYETLIPKDRKIVLLVLFLSDEFMTFETLSGIMQELLQQLSRRVGS